MATTNPAGGKGEFDLQGAIDGIKDKQMKDQVILLAGQTDISTRDKAFQMLIDAIKATFK